MLDIYFFNAGSGTVWWIVGYISFGGFFIGVAKAGDFTVVCGKVLIKDLLLLI